MKKNGEVEDGKRGFTLSLKSMFYIFLAFSIILLFYFLPTPAGLTDDGKIMIGILLMSLVFWITETIPLAVTGLLIMVTQPLFGVNSPEAVFSSFGNQALFFLMGAFILTSALEKYGLHKKIALKLLSLFDTNPKNFTLGIMFSCAFLSFIIPEHGVAVLFMTIISSILISMKLQPKASNFGKISMLSVAYGCSIGSLGTLIGGARNPLAIGFLSNLDAPIYVGFFDWMLYSMPIVFISIPVVWFLLNLCFPIEIKDITIAKKSMSNQSTINKKIGRQELIVIGIFVLTISLWILFPSPEFLGLGGIAIIGSILMVLTGSISWKDVEKTLPWGLLLVYGGAITLGAGMQKTGAGLWIAHRLFDFSQGNPYFVIFLLIVITIFLTEVMSNVGAVALLLPIGFGISAEIPGLSPLLVTMLVALSGGLAFMLVIATPGNAITYSAGYYSTRDLLKVGVLANMACICIIFLIAIIYWKGVLGI